MQNKIQVLIRVSIAKTKYQMLFLFNYSMGDCMTVKILALPSLDRMEL
jgi:hypothetical protein